MFHGVSWRRPERVDLLDEEGGRTSAAGNGRRLGRSLKVEREDVLGRGKRRSGGVGRPVLGLDGGGIRGGSSFDGPKEPGPGGGSLGRLERCDGLADFHLEYSLTILAIIKSEFKKNLYKSKLLYNVYFIIN